MPPKDPTKDDALLEKVFSIVSTALDALMPRVALLEQRVEGIERRLSDLSIELAKASAENEDDMNDGLILNMTQVAKVLGVSRTTVYRFVDTGMLEAKKLSVGEGTPRTIVLSEDLDRFIQNLPSASADAKPTDVKS